MGNRNFIHHLSIIPISIQNTHNDKQRLHHVETKKQEFIAKSDSIVAYSLKCNDSIYTEKARSRIRKKMLITLTFLSLLCCYREAVAEGGANGSIHRTSSNSRLATNSTVRPTTTESTPAMTSTSSNRPATNSTIRPTTPESTLNVNNSNTPNKPKNSVNVTLHEHDIPFFSAEIKNRLATWKKLLQNTSRHCIEPNYTNQRPIEIDFPVFGVKEDVEDGFLPLETILPVLVRRRKKHDLVQIAYMAILELWPLLVLCFSCAALSGILVWILVSCFCTRSFL